MKFKMVRNVIFAGALAFAFTGCVSGGTTSTEVTDVEEIDVNQDSAEVVDTDDETNIDISGEPIKIGGIGPLTGENAQYGTQAFNGVKLAFEQKGANIDFITYDDDADAAKATNLYQRLANNDEVVAIIGAVTSGSTSAVASASQVDKLPLLSPTATQDDITPIGDNVFRACFKDSFQGEIMARYSYEDLGNRKVAVIYNNSSDYSTGLSESFIGTFEELGGEVVISESYSNTDIDFKTQLNKIASSEAESLFIPDYYEKVALMAKQVSDVGLDVTLLGADGWGGVLDIVEDASILENSYIVNSFSLEDDNEIVQDFITTYTEKYNEAPSSFSASGYDAGIILLDAIERAGSLEKEDIIKAISETNIDSVGGNITFDENGDPIKGAMILEITGGEAKLVKKMQ